MTPRSVAVRLGAYALALALGAFALRWLEYQVAVRQFAGEIYVALIAVAFTALGAWLALRLTRRQATQEFRPNRRALAYLGISRRECEVLALLAEGLTNEQIGERLYVSANTVKTHLQHLYGKLEVSRRTQAVAKARELGLIA